ATNGTFTTPNNIGGNSATLTGATVGNLTANRYFRAVVTNAPCLAATSNTITVTVSPASVGGSITGGTTPICQGSATGTMTLSGHTGSVVKWQKRVNAGSWQDITNTATTYSETPSSAGTWDYRAVVKSGACLEAVSGIRTIIVQAPSVAGGTPTGGSSPVCVGSSIGTLSVNNTPTIVGSVVRWERRRITAPAIGWTAIPSSANNTF